ncbi:MAG: precorrin-3B C(17)-methyltransferase, partial [Pseudomonadota bacterium]
GFARALDVLRTHCEPARPVILARAVSTPEERLDVRLLADTEPEMADMRTVVLIGSSQTRIVAHARGVHVYTPRGVGP